MTKNFSLFPFSFIFLLLVPCHFTTFSSILVEISPNESMNTISSRLLEKGVIKSSILLRLLLRFTGRDRKVQAGVYEFDDSVSMWHVAKKLTSGQEKLFSLVFTPGETIRELIIKLRENYGGSKKTWKKAFSPKRYASFFVRVPLSLEGFLEPETYFFPKRASPEKVVKTLFFKRIAFLKSLPRNGFKNGKITPRLYDRIILASIIEREASLRLEMPFMASVFFNRLRKGMPLGASPTVNYILNRKSGYVTLKESKIKNPYNTYLYAGLPPTPISNPGADAVYSVFLPTSTSYYFFVSKNDGSHYFSSTYRSHLKAKRYFETMNPLQR